jgi:hypothetical protein
MQSKKRSILESVVNVIVGFGIALMSQIIIFPLFDINSSFRNNFWIAIWFTVISIIRSYILRRIFNRKDDKILKKEDCIKQEIKETLKNKYYLKQCNKKCVFHNKPIRHCRILCKKYIYQDEGYCSLYTKGFLK